MSELKEKSQSTAVCVVSYDDENDSFYFHENALKSVIKENKVENLPVVVISVCGAFRTGKSFLLSCFVRMLSSISEDWLGNENKPLSLDAFKWKGGCIKETYGILVCNKVFRLKVSEEKEVAVVLMDCEGTFDSVSTKKESLTFFSLCTLLSSMQIYNLKNQIERDDLQHLNMFNTYSKLNKKAFEGKPFQNITFLIRDWSCSEQYYYGADGGNKYLEEQWLTEKTKKNTDLNKLRETLKSCYEKMSCYLLPHPGEKLSSTLNFSGNVNAINANFRYELKLFIDSMLNEENIQIKKVNGAELKCHEFVQLFGDYVKAYNKTNISYASTPAEALSEFYYRNNVENFLLVYKNFIRSKCKLEIGNADDLMNYCNVGKTKAFVQFKNTKTIDDRCKMKYKEILTESIDNDLTILKDKLLAEKSIHKNKLFEADKECNHKEAELFLLYKTTMTSVCKLKVVDETSLLNNHLEQSKKVEASLKRFLEGIKINDENYIFKVDESFLTKIKMFYKDKLKYRTEDHFKFLKSAFKVEAAQIENIKIKAENRCRDRADFCLAKFKSQLLECLSDENFDIENPGEFNLDDFKSSAIDNFVLKTAEDTIEKPEFMFKSSTFSTVETEKRVHEKLAKDIESHYTYFKTKASKKNQKLIQMYSAQAFYDKNVEMSFKEYDQKLIGMFKQIQNLEKLEETHNETKIDVIEYYELQNETYHINLNNFGSSSNKLLNEEYKNFQSQRKLRLLERLDNRNLSNKTQLHLELTLCEKLGHEIKQFYSEKSDKLSKEYETFMSNKVSNFSHKKFWRFFSLGWSSQTQNQAAEIDKFHSDKKSEAMIKFNNENFGLENKTNFQFGVGRALRKLEEDVKNENYKDFNKKIEKSWISVRKIWKKKNQFF